VQHMGVVPEVMEEKKTEIAPREQGESTVPATNFMEQLNAANAVPREMPSTETALPPALRDRRPMFVLLAAGAIGSAVVLWRLLAG
jgi:hypothetical protein